ncbi:helix-turn-helix domain-containing protein [Lentilactobacillus sp. SPB1-3]|uniref:Helix-turn-helix domain-containing protein n=1 Tax=Lentilactobacillus terminaliae TaxID=3003483 RepID=A0ACD5DDN6_9LACO|nr:helix-turn-helix transcriptional regulator [Lentilactobacillus sp. SPB1-3]MCZ0978140.1 helix-turn-helix transcriptional regulator [Lentilactobacillus sp. SPB1-3]
MNNLGNKIKQLRKNKHLTQKQLGDLVHLTPQVISNIERGYTSASAEDLANFSRVFNVSIDELSKNDINSYDPSTPSWATDKDINDLHNFLAENGKMTYKGMDLTKEQRERVDQIITQVFWEELEKDKRKNER